MKFRLTLKPPPWKLGQHPSTQISVLRASDWEHYDSPAVVRKHGAEYLDRIRKNVKPLTVKPKTHPSDPHWMAP